MCDVLPLLCVYREKHDTFLCLFYVSYGLMHRTAFPDAADIDMKGFTVSSIHNHDIYVMLY